MFIPKPPPGLSEQEKAAHPSWRRYTSKYRRKRRVVRDLWLYSGVLMVVVPFPLLLVMALGTTLLSFVILDETP